ncbi:MAG: Uma2 family endonuclease [Streptosporangiaceae bacterium]
MSEIYDWAKNTPLQPEPITVEIWKQLPEEFCRQVEIVDGQAVRCESPSRLHQKMARHLANMAEQAARLHASESGECMDADMDFDVVLWQLPRTHIRRPDVTVFRCVPEDEKPLPSHYALLVIEVVSTSARVDTVDKRAEYATAGIPWYWIVRLDDSGVSRIEVLALDHGISGYRQVTVLEPGDLGEVIGPIRISLDWPRLRA